MAPCCPPTAPLDSPRCPARPCRRQRTGQLQPRHVSWSPVPGGAPTDAPHCLGEPRVRPQPSELTFSSAETSAILGSGAGLRLLMNSSTSKRTRLSPTQPQATGRTAGPPEADRGPRHPPSPVDSQVPWQGWHGLRATTNLGPQAAAAQPTALPGSEGGLPPEAQQPLQAQHPRPHTRTRSSMALPCARTVDARAVPRASGPQACLGRVCPHLCPGCSPPRRSWCRSAPSRRRHGSACGGRRSWGPPGSPEHTGRKAERGPQGREQVQDQAPTGQPPQQRWHGTWAWTHSPTAPRPHSPTARADGPTAPRPELTAPRPELTATQPHGPS